MEAGLPRTPGQRDGLVLMPLTSLALLRLTNDRALIGERRNGMWNNAGRVFMFVISSGFLIRAAWNLVRLRMG